MIRQDFLKEQKINESEIETITYKGQYYIINRLLASKWVKYHDDKAVW